MVSALVTKEKYKQREEKETFGGDAKVNGTHIDNGFMGITISPHFKFCIH